MFRSFKTCAYVLLVLMSPFANSTSAQPAEDVGFVSGYNGGVQGSLTASGEPYDHQSLTAAHPSYPFNTMVRVTRLDDNRTIVVRINDRMTSGPDHIIDLSGAAARKLGILDTGVTRVRIQREVGVSFLPEDDPPVAEARQRVEVEEVVEEVVVVVAQFTLQIGIFSTVHAAESFSSRFDHAWIAKVPVDSGTHYRVYYRRFVEESSARIAQRDLSKQGQESFLRTIAP